MATVASHEGRVFPGHFVGVHVPEVELALSTSRGEAKDDLKESGFGRALSAPHVGLAPRGGGGRGDRPHFENLLLGAPRWRPSPGAVEALAEAPAEAEPAPVEAGEPQEPPRAQPKMRPVAVAAAAQQLSLQLRFLLLFLLSIVPAASAASLLARRKALAV